MKTDGRGPETQYESFLQAPISATGHLVSRNLDFTGVVGVEVRPELKE